ncbi:hypothetical protein Tco_0589144, partial [Tanacetum coccineum]
DIPFNYLGLPIGSNMKSFASWKTLVDRFHMRLSLKIISVDWGSSKLIMVKKEVSIQMVVASRAFGLTLLEPLIFSIQKDDQNILPHLAVCYYLGQSIPRKVNLFNVEAFLGPTPYRLNLSSRGNGYSGISCPSCMPMDHMKLSVEMDWLMYPLFLIPRGYLAMVRAAFGFFLEGWRLSSLELVVPVRRKGTGYSLKDKKEAKPDKTEHEIGKSAKNRGQRNDARYGHYCIPQVPFIYPKPCYNQDFNFPQDFHDFQQQYLCCENCGGPHETFQCQPMNEDYYHEQNPCYDSNSFGFDQLQPPQCTVNYPIFNDQNSLLNSQNDLLNAQNEFLNYQNKLMEQMTSLCDMIPICYDDDDDEERSIPLKDTIIFGLPMCVAITPALSTEEPVDSLIMENEHLDKIPETESDEFIKSSIENLVQNPSESEDFSDIESECDVPVFDNSTTFSNHLFGADDDFSSSDDESFSDEDVPNEIYSNPLFDEKIISFKIDASIISMIDSLVEQFSAFQANYDTIIETLPTFSNPVEEIDIFSGPDESIPQGIESDDFDSEDDDNSTFLLEFESFYVDYPDSGDSTIDVVEDIPVDVPNILPTHPALQMDFTSFLLIMISDLILMFLLLPEIVTRFTIQGYALKSNPQDLLLHFLP